MSGMASSTRPESLGLVTTIITVAPTKHHEIAQHDRHRGADSRFDLGRVGGEPRDHLAGLRLVEERGREPRADGEDLAAQIGDDALAERQVTR